MKLGPHQTQLNCCDRAPGSLLLYFTLLILPMLVYSKQNLDWNVPMKSGYRCYLRCLAKCVDELGASSLTGLCTIKCSKYNEDKLCNKTDTACWSACRDLTIDNGSGPSPPLNVTVSYARFPQPSPYEADVQWTPDGNRATIFVIQYVDASNSFQSSSNIGINVTSINHWRFLKPHLCSKYAFRVASANRYGVSNFSNVVMLPEPVPMVPNPYYDLVSAELIDQPYPKMPDNDQIWNKTVRVIINFAPPPGWDLWRDIVDVTADFYPQQAGSRLIGFALKKRWIKGTSEFELLLPGVDNAPINFKLMFAVQKIITKCENAGKGNSDVGFHYPSQVYNPRRRMMLPVYEFELTCKNVLHSGCPYDVRDTLPSCGVNSTNVHISYNNLTKLIDADVSFGRLLEERNQPLLYYLIAYGEGEDQTELIDQLAPPALAHILGRLQLKNTTKRFRMEHLNPGKLYLFYICGIYGNSSDYIDWNVTSRYVVDLTDMAVQKRPVWKSEESTRTTLIAAPTAAALTMAAIACLIIVKKRRRRPGRNQNETCSSMEMVENQYVEQPRRFDKWEIPRRRLIIHKDEKLGSGAFGAVYKGRVMGSLLAPESTHAQSTEEKMKTEKCIAVKVLPEFADEKSKSEFRSEINIMKQLGYDERLVNMLACVTADDPLCLVVEYCPYGDLLRYLRVRKTYMVDLERLGIDLNDLGTNDQIDHDMLISMKDVLSFAWQISGGLDYISQKGYIHRDVAARNILVDTGRRVKIGDFGLCRYSSKDPIYMGKGGRLPIKWMALEALKRYEFTSKSDVWSFGVLLFELFTLGNAPYPGMDPADVERFLDSGRRMSQPAQCPLEFYTIMLSCWEDSPDCRPSFANLRQRLSRMLENESADTYYVKIQPSIVVDIEPRRSAVMEELDLEDQVFETEPDEGRESFAFAPPIPSRPIRPSRTAEETHVAPTSPTRRSHQSDEPIPIRHSVKYTPSIELSPLPEEKTDRASVSSTVGIGTSCIEIDIEPPRVRRRSSVVSAQIGLQKD